MAKLILGNRPQVEVKTYAREYSRFLLTESRGDIEEESLGAAQRAGVPAEATLSREEDRARDLVTYVWRWWEVTL
ncbi:hypothetical protein SEA_SANSA_41 [Microbacterium phage Sansa]|uniref:Uncharacterized protein n=1 Tax=Microbacterium phage Sansa TaxID=2250298 RepID=A0A345L012_9CAUD|nr:hypothetical protein SEA_SANSA_41 [Microbacterium phage Sansa]